MNGRTTGGVKPGPEKLNAGSLRLPLHPLESHVASKLVSEPALTSDAAVINNIERTFR
jgi:hypothetical protein